MLVVYFIIGVVVLVILAMIFASHHPNFKMTSSAVGTVVSAEERQIPYQGGGHRYETELTCRFTAGGAERTLRLTLPGRHAKRFPAGKPVPVRYYPANPDVARVAVR
jgi:hypothetical protein